MNAVNLRRNIRKTITYFGLICFFVFILVPFIMIILTALKNTPEIIDMPNRNLWQRIMPDSFTNFENIKAVLFGYASQLNGTPFYRFIINSFIVTFFSLIPSLGFSLSAAYGFSKYQFCGKNVIFYMFLGILLIPMEMISIPLFLMVSRLRLGNSYIGMMIPQFISAFGIFLIKASMDPIPSSYIEAGRIDGAGEFWIFRRIIIPMVKTAVVTFIIIKSIWNWNDFFWPMLIVTEEPMKTITLGLSKFSNDLFKEYGQLTSAVLLSIIPLLIVFIFCHRNIKAGLMNTGVKG
jgi:ABC-type glycerol-3-phosphate transport system permease component